MQSSNLPKKPTLTTPLDSKLNRHFLACSAFVGTAVLMTGQRGEAAIRYSGPQNFPVPTTNGQGGVYIDLEIFQHYNSITNGSAGGTPGPLTATWDVNFYRTGGGNLRWYYNANTFAVFNTNHVAALTAGVTIDGSSSFGTFQTMLPEYLNNTAFMGVQFRGTNNTPLFGWIQVAGGPTQGFPATIVDWAFEDSGAGIMAGAVPEPGTLALGFLGAGAVGIVAWRKRKKV